MAETSKQPFPWLHFNFGAVVGAAITLGTIAFFYAFKTQNPNRDTEISSAQVLKHDGVSISGKQ